MIQQESPAAPTAQVAAMGADWAMIDTLLGGTGAMRAAGRRYLPQSPAESDAVYKYRLSVSTLFNAFGHTVKTLSGKPFKEPLKLGDDVPPTIATYCDDIDMDGRNLHAFSHEVFSVALSHGLSHILVEYPRMPAGQTLADQRKSGARPYFCHIRPQSILGWRKERIAGVATLTQLRFMECIEEPVGQWGSEEIDQIRVLDRVIDAGGKSRVAWSTYRQTKEKVWALYESGLSSIGVIPLATIYGQRTGFMTAISPLRDLAFLNVKHWQSDSDQFNILHVARVPILFAAGFANSGNTLIVGSGDAVTNDSDQAKLMYVEHTGAAIGAGRESLKDLEDQMSLLGAQLLVRKPGMATATEKAIDSAESNSQLGLMTNDMEDTLALSLQYAAMWDGLPDGGSVELNKDFGITEDDAKELESLLEAKKLGGVVSGETVFDEFRRRGVINEERTWKDELLRLANELRPIEPKLSAVV